MRVVIDNRVLHHQWMGLLKVQEFRSGCQQGETTRFMMEIRTEGFPDLSLGGEELLQTEPRGLTTRITGTQGSRFWGMQASFWTSISNNDQEGDVKNQGRTVDTLEDPIGSCLT